MKFRIKKVDGRFRVAMNEGREWNQITNSFASVKAAEAFITKSAKTLGLYEGEYAVVYAKSLKEDDTAAKTGKEDVDGFEDDFVDGATADTTPDNGEDTGAEEGTEDVDDFEDDFVDGATADTVPSDAEDNGAEEGTEDVDDFESRFIESEDEDEAAEKVDEDEDSDDDTTDKVDEDEDEDSETTDKVDEDEDADSDETEKVEEDEDSDDDTTDKVDEDEDDTTDKGDEISEDEDEEDDKDITLESIKISAKLDKATVAKFSKVLGLNESKSSDIVALFESVMSEKAGEVSKKLNEAYKTRYRAKSRKFESRMTKKIDGYLSEEVSKWHRANRVTIEKSIKHQLTDSIVNEMMEVFRRFNVKIPEGKRDLYVESIADRKNLQKELKSVRNQLAEAESVVFEHEKKALIESMTKGLTDMSKGKVSRMIEGFETEDLGALKTRMKFIIENFTSAKTTKSSKTIVESRSKDNSLGLNENTDKVDEFAEVKKWL